MATKKTFSVSTQKGLNLREGPSKDTAVIRVLPFGAKVVIEESTEAPEGWVAIKGGGFVMKEFLQ